MTLRLSYKLQWPEKRMIVNQSADWGKEGEINISPDNIEVNTEYHTELFDSLVLSHAFEA